MVHFLEQLVDSIYRPSYWYQLIRHWAANCLPAGTAERPCVRVQDAVEEVQKLL